MYFEAKVGKNALGCKHHADFVLSEVKKVVCVGKLCLFLQLYEKEAEVCVLGEVEYGGEQLPYVETNKVYVFPEPAFGSAKERKAYTRLVYNVKKVLPIAKECNRIIVETYEYLETLPDKRARDAHMRLVEADIKERYTPRMKKLTYAQGKLLIKLIYRECNSSSYQLIQAFLGPVKAGFYQAFAWVFGASLRKDYDAAGEDRLTERVVLQVEAGQL